MDDKIGRDVRSVDINDVCIFMGFHDPNVDDNQFKKYYPIKI